MPDTPTTIERAVCPECGWSTYPSDGIDDTGCPRPGNCPGTLEAQTFVSEAALRELASDWEDAASVARRMGMDNCQRVLENCSDQLTGILDGGENR